MRDVMELFCWWFRCAIIAPSFSSEESMKMRERKEVSVFEYINPFWTAQSWFCLSSLCQMNYTQREWVFAFFVVEIRGKKMSFHKWKSMGKYEIKFNQNFFIHMEIMVQMKWKSDTPFFEINVRTTLAPWVKLVCKPGLSNQSHALTWASEAVADWGTTSAIFLLSFLHASALFGMHGRLRMSATKLMAMHIAVVTMRRTPKPALR